ncbi:reticulon-4-like isoform X2 [Planococcus citri]|uniref:reticulon-4-like isoform X2 n=1 Tax=Planococcus citri TaxID=170843 RepID=UPI0031F93037
MEPVNTSVDTSKPPAFDKLESIEHKLANEVDHGMAKSYDVDDFLNLQKSPSNGLLDSYHENMTPENEHQSEFFTKEKEFHEPSKLQSSNDDLNNLPSPPKSSELHEFLPDYSSSYGVPKNETSFCGTDKLNDLANFVVNDDVEVFKIPAGKENSTKNDSSSLLEFDPLNEPIIANRDHHDEFASSLTRSTYQLPDDIIEPVTEFKETLPTESAIPSKSDKEIGDKLKEIIDDSPRSGSPDFLELDAEDLKPIDVKTDSVKPVDVKPIDSKPIDVKPTITKPVEEKPIDTKPVEKVPEKPTNVETKKTKVEYFQDKPEIGPKELFSKYGLVEAFIYWRDPKLSAIVFVSGLVLLLSMAYYSLISVVANTGLTILVLAMGFRIYKHVLQAVQKTDQGHPYSVFLEWDLKLPQEKVHELVDTVLIHINAYVSELRRLFLIENWMESVRFAVVLWVLTYVGSWFNGLTLVIIAFVSLFTLPKVYENNKVQIDQNLALVHAKLEELTNKIKDVLPALLRKKLPEKKE